MMVIKLVTALRYKHVFTVRGGGHFPVDMLRYDSCFPTTSEAALAIFEVGSVREVQLARYTDSKTLKVTAARWASFGWTIVTTEEK